MANMSDFSNFVATGDFQSISISSTVDLSTKFGNASKLLISAVGGAATISFGSLDPGSTGHPIASGDSIIIRMQPNVKIKGTTAVVTPGR